ncbi:glycoside hydrolase family 18 [Sphingobacterium deserti]|uniref:Endo-beta-N-acetylglucosaminidase n=1 Tax=Sphingobacterium deserti TaxID=1229276 RepID=A0A0B8T5M5_9SPHI|nr:glycoside hydrolase family 18 [Sphingobacterium deserti]KGE12994.1 endo-beta-N-acetylglucosaminidase [Sphingobacterium deserti]
MKDTKIILYTLLGVSTLLLGACEKQNLPTPEAVERLVEARSEDYYTNLRAYKKSDHQIYYGWFGGSGAAGGPDIITVMDHIPDSVDIVSMWGGLPPLGSYNHKKMNETQRIKGTRFISVALAFDTFLDRYAEQDFVTTFAGQGEARLIEGFKLVAENVAKQVNEYGLDGFDLDYEPSPRDLLYNNRNAELLIIELGKVLGPQSGSGKLLVVDMFTERLPATVVPYLDYFVVQAYSPQGGNVASLPNRFRQIPGMPFEKCIAGENFETLWETGGLLAAYAAWNPQGGKKGGIAAYLPNYEYALNPEYRWTRAAIQIMNPAVR